MYVYYNPHPSQESTGDCVIRAFTKVFGATWDDVYLELVAFGFIVKDWPDNISVWGRYLLEHGFRRYQIPNTCPHCYTISDFCADHPDGTYVVATSNHVVAVVSGDYYDSWNSGNEVVAHIYAKGN